MAHRGATAFAPENTLAAYAEAMNRNADGVEIYIRESVNGLLYLFHDESLEGHTNGKGRGKDLTYAALARLQVRGGDPDRPHTQCIPTLAAFIELARQRDILIHLDIKEPGIQDPLKRMFDAADIWDHVVHINRGHADKLQQWSQVHRETYKGWVEDLGSSPEGAIVRKFFARPGRLIFCKQDPHRAFTRLKQRWRPLEARAVPASVFAR